MGKFNGIQYIKDQYLSTPPDISSIARDLSGKTVVVIGANVGLGYETAKHFASMKPARVILGCRTKEKAETAAEEIQKTASSGTVVEPWVIDLMNFKTVSDFADRYEKEGNGQLDILVMNAGINVAGKYSKDESGWEQSIKVNHLSTSLLTLLLLPYVKKAPFSRPTPCIVIVGSETHYFVTLSNQAKKPNILEALNEDSSGGIMKQRYYHTKLLNLLFARALAARLSSPSAENRNPVVTVVNPGWCKTQLTRDQTFVTKCVLGMASILRRSAEEGSRMIVWSALSHLDNTLHGRYTNSFRVDEESDYSISPEGKEVEGRIWNETIAILEKVDPRVTTIVREELANH